MDRNEAVNYLKELLKICNEMSPEAVSFEKPQDDTQGYTVRIKGTIHDTDRQAVRNIAKRYSLTVKEENGAVLISTTK